MATRRNSFPRPPGGLRKPLGKACSRNRLRMSVNIISERCSRASAASAGGAAATLQCTADTRHHCTHASTDRALPPRRRPHLRRGELPLRSRFPTTVRHIMRGGRRRHATRCTADTRHDAHASTDPALPPRRRPHLRRGELRADPGTVDANPTTGSTTYPPSPCSPACG